ncbi:hypothetical protein [Methanobacterium oryzae]|uniref:hypothetical protein n=1 Tax=Methanobacterium oryzae TaxID=69540 RepID=UPI003D25AA5E
MSNVERFKEIITQIPFEHNDLSVVNRKEYQPLFEELFDIYINSSPIEKSSINEFVQNDRDLSYKFVHWVPPCLESDPKRYVMYRLISAAIRDGRPDFRDDLLELVHLYDFLEEKGLDAQEIFKEVVAISGSFLFDQVMDPKRREELRF